MIKTNKSLIVALLAVAASITTPLVASPVTLSAVNSGWYNNGGSFNGTLNNFDQITGNYNDWLGFDLSSISGTITSATLQLFSDPSNAANQSVTWWDVSTPYSQLGTVSGVAIYNDLGSGTAFSTGIQNPGVINNFTLNAAGLSSLNAAASFWAVGGSVATGGPSFGYTSGVGSGDYLKLVLDVSDNNSVPDGGTTAVLLGSALFSLAALRRRFARG